MKLLVIEDDPSIRNLLALMLGSALPQASIASVESVQAALDQATVDTDLVLLDLGLPDMSGWEALTLLRQRSPYARVLIVSATDGPEQRVEAARMGVDGFLIKPFRIAHLIEETTRLVRCIPRREPKC